MKALYDDSLARFIDWLFIRLINLLFYLTSECQSLIIFSVQKNPARDFHSVLNGMILYKTGVTQKDIVHSTKVKSKSMFLHFIPHIYIYFITKGSDNVDIEKRKQCKHKIYLYRLSPPLPLPKHIHTCIHKFKHLKPQKSTSTTKKQH